MHERGLTTSRLILRRWRVADREPFAAINADPEVMEHFPAPLGGEQSDELVERIEAGFEANGFGLWALEFGFGEAGLGEIVSFASAGNARSRAVMERIGMTHDPADDFDHPSLPAGHPLRRHVLYRQVPRHPDRR